MRRRQLRQLQDRRTERLLRRSHTAAAQQPQVSDDPGAAPGPDDGRVPPTSNWTSASAVADAA